MTHFHPSLRMIGQRGVIFMRCGRSPWAFLLVGCGLGLLLGVLISAAVAAVLLGAACLIAGILLLKR